MAVRRRDREFTEAEIEQNTVDDTGAIVGMTPSSFRLKREGIYNVKLSKTGYQSVESVVSHKVAGGGATGMAGNVLLGGVIGAVVDSNTGAMLNLTPNPLKVVMSPADEPPDTADETPAEPTTKLSDDDAETDAAGAQADADASDGEAGADSSVDETALDSSDDEIDADSSVDDSDPNSSADESGADSSVNETAAGTSDEQAGTNSPDETAEERLAEADN